MAGITTPVLATLAAVNTGRRAVDQIGDLVGGSSSKKRERALLTAEQQADGADLAARDAAEIEALRKRNVNEAARIQTQGQADERRRQRALRLAVGRTRAQLGAQGVGTGDGSGEAILLGQIRQAEEEQADSARLDALRLAALGDEEEAARRRNLLDLTRQQERQRLERLARGM